MANYLMNKNSQSNGDHEVHKETCDRLPKPENRFILGNFSSCKEAINRARIYDSKADGCYYCSRECHNS